MKGPQEIIKAFNDSLGAELASINQYFLHARILQSWGLGQLGQQEFQAALDEMKHADELIQRILFLEGLPNVQRIGRVQIGQNVPEILQFDLQLEMEAIPRLKKSVALCEQEQDFASRDLLSKILASEEAHVDWLETQQGLIEKMGLENYLQGHMASPSSP